MGPHPNGAYLIPAAAAAAHLQCKLSKCYVFELSDLFFVRMLIEHGLERDGWLVL